MRVQEYIRLLMVLTLDYGVARHLLDEAAFFVRVEVEVKGIHCRKEKE